MILKWLCREETVSKRDYDAVVADNRYRAEQVTDLTGQCSVLGLNEAVARQLAEEALTLLLTVDTRRTGGMALQRKIADLVQRAQRMGLLQEKSEGE